MSELETLQHEIHDIKRNQEFIIKLLSPKEYTVSKVAELTQRSRQAVKSWLENNCEPEVDYFLKNGKIILSEKAALHYINQRR